MGTCYGLYDMDEKESADLGKKFWERGGFQMPAERILKFLYDHAGNDVRFLPDTGSLPDCKDDSDEWKEVDSWHWENGKPPPDSDLE